MKKIKNWKLVEVLNSKTNFMKIIYLTIVVFYFLFFIVYLFAPSITYFFLKVNPNIIEVRSLTNDEYLALDDARKVIHNIVVWFIFASFLVCCSSRIVLYYKLLPMTKLVKFIFRFSLVVFLILYIANGINFVPIGPIR